MHFTDIFIRRPVFAMVLSLILFLIGLRAFYEIPVREYPNIEASVIDVSTTYSGASAQLMEGFVTSPLENALAGVQGLDYIRSSSTQGTSDIILRFALGYDINTAIADVSNAVSSVRTDLPANVNDPVISKKDPSSDPTIYISFTSDTMSVEAITDYLERVVQPQLQTMPGVGQARVFGERRYSMRLWLDPERMAAHNVTPSDVIAALSRSNVQAAPGVLQAPYIQIAVNAQTDLTTVDQFNNLALHNTNGVLTRLRDVGYAVLGPADYSTVSVNINGNMKAVVMGVIPQPAANPLNISKEFLKIMPDMQASLPAGLHMELTWDSSKFIRASLNEVRKTIIEATIFVVIVIFLFLGSMRSVIIPVVTIPLSMIGVCSLMLAMGYSINILTLLAFVLAVGLVVDDAIVVVENIHRHIEQGLAPFDAALLGAREIGFAIIAMTLTLAAVYAPIGFMPDITGLLFREFAFTLAGAVLVSGFVALTLSPMMCSRLLRHDPNNHGFAQRIDELFNELMVKYRGWLTHFLSKRKIVLIVAGVVYLACYVLYTTLNSELAPFEDKGAVLIFMNAPTSANLPYVEKYTGELKDIFKKVPEVREYLIANGIPNSNNAISYLILSPWSERSRSAQQIIEELFPMLWGIPGLAAFPMNLPPLPGSGDENPVQFLLKTTGSYEELYQASQKIINEAKQNPGLVNVDSDLKLDKPQVNIIVDRDKANLLGVSSGDIADALNTLLGQPTPSHFQMNGRSYDVIPQIFLKHMSYAEQLNNIYLRTVSGKLTPLANLIEIKQTVAPQSLNHFQQLRSVALTSNLAHGYTQGQALDYFRKLAKDLPENIQFDYAAQSRQFVQASGAMEQTFAFAVIFIFLILAAQFESFRDPLIVMISVPLSLTGALIGVHLIGGTLNIYTQIGLVTLIGLISKHGILIVEFANQQQEKGLSIIDAVIESASLRLRPILMTTGAMLLGALPLVISTGPGAVSRRELGMTILGGMSFGTLLTLFVVPTVYTYLATNKNKNINKPIAAQPTVLSH